MSTGTNLNASCVLHHGQSGSETKLSLGWSDHLMCMVDRNVTFTDSVDKVCLLASRASLHGDQAAFVSLIRISDQLLHYLLVLQSD